MTLTRRLRPSASRVRAGGGPVALIALAATTMLMQGDQSALEAQPAMISGISPTTWSDRPNC